MYTKCGKSKVSVTAVRNWTANELRGARRTTFFPSRFRVHVTTTTTTTPPLPNTPAFYRNIYIRIIILDSTRLYIYTMHFVTTMLRRTIHAIRKIERFRPRVIYVVQRRIIRIVDSEDIFTRREFKVRPLNVLAIITPV